MNRLGRMDAVIHNAGVDTGPHILAVNVVAPYLLTRSSTAPSGWSTSAAACTAADDPAGWVPTKMGGAGAPDDLRLGHLTQEWLATSEEPDARTSGGYWHHQRRTEPHPAAGDRRFQDQLLDDLARFTTTRLA